MVHADRAPEVLQQRQQVLTAAYLAHPERFVRGQPLPGVLPQAVWINPPQARAEVVWSREPGFCYFWPVKSRGDIRQPPLSLETRVSLLISDSAVSKLLTRSAAIFHTFTAAPGANAVQLLVEAPLAGGWLAVEETMLVRVITRSTYMLAGQAVATRVSGDPEANNGLFYLYSDHLGSATAMTGPNGSLVDEVVRYYPFGGYRGGSGPNAVTDRGFTGQRENMSLGLYYYQARYYLPGIGRFASADTIVPDPTNPQSFNRYSYGYNNPVKYIDEDGHIPILPLLFKAGANGAADLMVQAAANYFFDPSVTSVDQAFENINWWQVARSAAEGAILFTVPGGRWGRAAFTASGDVLVNALHYGEDYTAEQALLDFGIGFIGDLAGGGIGDLIERYGIPNVANGLRKMGLDVDNITDLTGFNLRGTYSIGFRDEAAIGHIFNRPHHNIVDTVANRNLLLDVANNADNLLGTDQWGKQWYALTRNGSD